MAAREGEARELAHTLACTCVGMHTCVLVWLRHYYGGKEWLTVCRSFWTQTHVGTGGGTVVCLRVVKLADWTLLS